MARDPSEYVFADNGRPVVVGEAPTPALWDQYQADPVNSAAVPGVSGAKDGSEAWVTTLDGGSVEFSPMTDGEAIYVASGAEGGSTTGYLHRVNPSDGSIEWQNTYGSSVVYGGTIKDGVIYFTEYDTNLYAVNASDGSQVWSAGGLGNYMYCPPAVASGICLVAGGYNGPTVAAYDISDGSQLWTYTNVEASYYKPAYNAEADTFYISANYGSVAALKPDGTEVWQTSIGSYSSCDPTLHNGVLMVGNKSDELVALDPSDGSELWRFSNGDSAEYNYPPAVADGVAYTVPAGLDKMYAINVSDGSMAWSNVVANYGVETPPSYADGMVYVADGVYEEYYGVNAEDGSVAYTYVGQADATRKCQPAVHNGVTYYGDGSGNLYALQ